MIAAEWRFRAVKNVVFRACRCFWKKLRLLPSERDGQILLQLFGLTVCHVFLLILELFHWSFLELEQLNHYVVQELLSVSLVAKDEEDLLVEVMDEFGHSLLFDGNRISMHKVVEEWFWQAFLLLCVFLFTWIDFTMVVCDLRLSLSIQLLMVIDWDLGDELSYRHVVHEKLVQVVSLEQSSKTLAS